MTPRAVLHYGSVHKGLHTYTNANTPEHTYKYSQEQLGAKIESQLCMSSGTCSSIPSHPTLQLCKCHFTFMQVYTGIRVHVAPWPINHLPWYIIALAIKTSWFLPSSTCISSPHFLSCPFLPMHWHAIPGQTIYRLSSCLSLFLLPDASPRPMVLSSPLETVRLALSS